MCLHVLINWRWLYLLLLKKKIDPRNGEILVFFMALKTHLA